MVFADEASGNRLQVVWPNGYSARLMNGRAELVPPDGSVLARDGDVISHLAFWSSRQRRPPGMP